MKMERRKMASTYETKAAQQRPTFVGFFRIETLAVLFFNGKYYAESSHQ
jgi:hypothetical protein